MNYSANRFSLILNLFKSRKFSSKTARFLLTLGVTSLLVSQNATPGLAELEDSPKTVVDEAWQIINSQYVDRDFDYAEWKVQRNQLLHQEYPSRKAAYQAIRKSLKNLGDPYTRFLSPEEHQDLKSQISGELSGIGIRLGISEKTGKLTIFEPIPNSPAVKAGLKAGDRITSIDGKSTKLMSLEQASAEIKGENGTEVKLKIVRPDRPEFTVAVERANIELPSLSYELKEEQNSKVGYIKLDEFTSHSSEEMQKAIKELSSENPSGFILDLRGNPGGLLFTSVEIAQMWMQKGEIVHTIDRQGGNRKFSANDSALTDLPLVVLVNEYSASASEILAGALKENKRAKVVGSQTYGKGTVQSVNELADGSGLAVTIARYYPPSGMDINKKGIAPDIKVDLNLKQQADLQIDPKLLATQSDPQYSKAVAILQGEATTEEEATTDNSTAKNDDLLPLPLIKTNKTR